MKICAVGSELSIADTHIYKDAQRQTDMTTKLTVAFRNFANAPKNEQVVSQQLLNAGYWIAR